MTISVLPPLGYPQVVSQPGSNKNWGSDFESNQFITSAIDGAVVEPSVNIYWVGSGKLNSQEVTAKEGIFDVSVPTVIASVYLRVNISGYTHWNLGNVTLPQINNPVDFGNKTTTIGQVFSIVNGEISILSINQITSNEGFSLILPVGDYAISILYVNMNQDSEIKFAFDTVSVRLRLDGETFYPYETTSLPFQSNIVDVFSQKTVRFNATATYKVGNAAAYARNFTTGLESVKNTSFELTMGDENNQLENELDIYSGEDPPSIILDATVNTTGFSGIQLAATNDAVQGLVLFVDALGVHDDIPSMVTVQNGENYIGLVTLIPFGIWHSGIPLPDWALSGILSGVDWDWRASSFVVEDHLSNRTIEFDSSFDFIGTENGEFITIALRSNVTITKTNDSSGFFVFSTIASFVFLYLLNLKSKKRRIVTNDFSR